MGPDRALPISTWKPSDDNLKLVTELLLSTSCTPPGLAFPSPLPLPTVAHTWPSTHNPVEGGCFTPDPP